MARPFSDIAARLRALTLKSQDKPIIGEYAADLIAKHFVTGSTMMDVSPDMSMEDRAQRADDQEDDGDQVDDEGELADGEEYKDTVMKDDEDDQWVGSDDEGEFPNEEELLAKLRSYRTHIEGNYKATFNGVVPGAIRQMYDHQKKAVAFGLRATEAATKGGILADAPGMGKTQPALSLVALKQKTTQGPSIFVGPLSCNQQVMQEIKTTFEPGSLPNLHLYGSYVSPRSLLKYKLVVTSYSYLRAEYKRGVDFLQGIDDFRKGRTNKPPKRPKLTLLSEFWNDVPRGQFLILDEAHTIKNSFSQTYKATKILREHFETCFMMTGTPLDNTWMDSYALFTLLEDHSIRSPYHMRLAFTDMGAEIRDFRDREREKFEVAKKKKQRYQMKEVPAELKAQKGVPRDNYLTRMIQMMDAVTLCRDPEVVNRHLPPLHKEVVHFKLTPEDQAASDACYIKYEESRRDLSASKSARRAAGRKAIGGKASSKSKFGKSSGGTANGTADLKALTEAQQHAFHPMMVNIMSIIRKTNAAQKPDADGTSELTEDDLKKVEDWKRDLRKDENWRSARIDVALKVVDYIRDRDPDADIIIMDEGYFNLVVVDIAISKMEDPPAVSYYNGRVHPTERALIAEEFNKPCAGCRIMLATRATGGQGLNLQGANHLIRLGPWWKTTWEIQAEGRLYRTGQLREVFIWILEAQNCMVEDYKAKTRGFKDSTNMKVMRGIIQKIGATLKAARYIS
ncbi:SNF2 family N-terminal domain-containing protein 4 [Elsinoe fawcettii]|nr:SNF2 family N-terminal domain-containing protein 4 [Elsinoe fawcettii]